MTIQMLATWNGLEEESIYTLAPAEENRLIGLGLARAYTAGMDGVSDGSGTGQSSVSEGWRPPAAVLLHGLGDSITADQVAYWIQTCWQSGGFFRTGNNYGVSGNTSAQILARVPSLPAGSGLMAVMAGTNDAFNAVPSGTYVANIRQIWAGVKAKGYTPLAIMPPPYDAGGALSDRMSAAVYFAAEADGIPCFDPWTNCIVRSTGAWKTGTALDDKHPNFVGDAIAATDLLAQLRGTASRSLQPRFNTNTGLAGLLKSNVCFISDATSDGLADMPGGIASVSGACVPTLVSDVRGFNWQRFTISGVGFGQLLAYSGSGLPLGGREMMATVMVRASGLSGTQKIYARVETRPGFAYTYTINLNQAVDGSISEQVLQANFVVEAGATQVIFKMYAEGVSGTAAVIDFALPQVYDKQACLA